MRHAFFMLGVLLVASLGSSVSAQIPDIVNDHWYHTHATLTIDVQSWADDHPDIVELTSAGQTELGRELWVVRLSDWSKETKEDGTAKDMVYIDGGHHGNEHLGTELAFLVAQYYVDGWAAGEEEATRVLTNTEIHILIMLNADGNDLDTRWNVNQVDLNRNYAHRWDENETQSGDGAFSEAETLANSEYMNEFMKDADLYITMHTGVWIMLYPWGYMPDQPVDWELFHFIRDDVNENLSEIPIRNANQGLYPNRGTSRDYGYGIMGYPTFTFETDDEQFLLGSVESLDSRMAEELDVMRYLVDNVWYWRARLVLDSFELDGDEVSFDVSNHGRASTRNATLQYLVDENVVWESSNFTINATNSTSVSTTGFDYEGGEWRFSYQKRLINSATWVNESVEVGEYEIGFLAQSMATLVWVIQAGAVPIFVIGFAFWWSRKEEPLELINETPLDAELIG